MKLPTGLSEIKTPSRQTSAEDLLCIKHCAGPGASSSLTTLQAQCHFTEEESRAQRVKWLAQGCAAKGRQSWTLCSCRLSLSKQRNGMRKRQHLLSKSSPGTSTEVGWDGSNPLTYTPLVGLCDGSAPLQTLWVCLPTPTLWPCNSNPRCLPKNYESTCPHKDLYTSGSFVRNCQKLENNPNVHLQVNG